MKGDQIVCMCQRGQDHSIAKPIRCETAGVVISSPADPGFKDNATRLLFCVSVCMMEMFMDHDALA